MDILIQQDGRVQMNAVVLRPDRPEHRTVELVSRRPYQLKSQYQMPASALAEPVNTIERRFRRMGTEGDITVWVEQP